MVIGKSDNSKTNAHSLFSFKEMAAEQMTTDEMSVGEMA
jgi:hypothetical protein